MTTATTKDVLERLKRLQDLDLRIAQVERELNVAPAAAKDLATEIAAQEAQIKVLEDRARLLRAQVKLRENELKSVEQKIQRVKDQSSQVKTNKEFMAFRTEISTLQAEADRMQGEILKILEAIEEGDTKAKDHKAARDAAEARRKDAHDKAQGKLGDVRTKRDELAKQRPELLQGVPPEQREIYERVRKVRGNALAVVEGEYCSGCMERLIKNDVYAVQNASRLVQCKACNRILVAP